MDNRIIRYSYDQPLKNLRSCCPRGLVMQDGGNQVLCYKAQGNECPTATENELTLREEKNKMQGKLDIH